MKKIPSYMTTDYEARDKFMANHTTCKIGTGYDLYSYEGLNAKDLTTCIKKGWANINETQNESPSIGEILKFLKAHPDFTAIGYVVSPSRGDTRISIEGVIAEGGVPERSKQAFIDMFRKADEFTCDDGGCYRAWFD